MKTVLERFTAKFDVRPGGDCWWWTAGQVGNGYGRFSTGGLDIRAHRWAFEHWRGPIPAGLQIDHLCRNRLCVKPPHMEVVTNRVNVLRGVGPTARNARKTHCPQGHSYSGDNVYIYPDGGRSCRQCHNARQRRRYARLHEEQPRPDSGASSSPPATSTGTVRRSLGRDCAGRESNAQGLARRPGPAATQGSERRSQMRVAGQPGRVELHPENDEERQFLQETLDTGKDALLFWGDADEGGSALVINNTPLAGQPPAPTKAPEPAPAT